jgi:hypothetical protein
MKSQAPNKNIGRFTKSGNTMLNSKGDKTNVGRRPSKKASVTRKKSGNVKSDVLKNDVSKKDVSKSDVTKNDISTNDISKNDGSYRYCDPNASFLVHDVVRRGGCETFVIEFDGLADEPVRKPVKKPVKKFPELLKPKAPVPSDSSSQTSSPSAKIKPKKVPGLRSGSGKFSSLEIRKREKEISGQPVRSNEVKTKLARVAGNVNVSNNNNVNNSNSNNARQSLKKVQSKNVKNAGNFGSLRRFKE